jgi:rod shape-determining protein MreC
MHPRLINVPRGQDMAEGDIIVTSGFGGIYPKGIMIGTVSAVKNDSGGLLHYAVIEPATDFQRLEDVAVIVASREAPPEPWQPPKQTPGTETDPKAALAAQEAARRAAQQPPAPAQPAAQNQPAATNQPSAANPSAQPQPAVPAQPEPEPVPEPTPEPVPTAPAAPAPEQPKPAQPTPARPTIPGAGAKR